MTRLKALQLSAADLHDLFVEAATTERWLPAQKQRARLTWWPEMQAEWLSYADPTTIFEITLLLFVGAINQIPLHHH